jgi:AraC family transcriptional regulator of adaptative response / DNA-3-methyladenine glycosylase II
MQLDPDSCYRALQARDPRFDGVFFIGVTTTGIYCRPVCPARTPGPSRCRFFPSAAAAEQQAFRPCLRCRPELAPGNAPVDSTSRVARALAARIEAAATTDGTDLETLAEEFSLSSRQLRRIVREHLGVSPIGLVQTHRLHMAKRLLTETRMRIVDIAFASGFSSVRRFNSAFLAHYRLTPGRLRVTVGEGEPGAQIRLTIGYRPPLAWDELAGFFAKRTWAGVEEVTGGVVYRRTVELGENRGWVAVEPVSGRNYLRVEISQQLAPVLPEVLQRVRRQFDLDARPDLICKHLAEDERIGPLVRSCPGLRVPGGFDGFEVALRAILGQLVSVAAARTIGSRLTAAFGKPVEATGTLSLTTPSAVRLAGASVDDLASLGMTRQKAESIRALAAAVVERRLRLVPGPDPAAIMAQLQCLPGIGEWTAQYIAMRALGWPDACPYGDLGLRQALGLKTNREVKQVAERWSPWRAYGAIYSWHLLARRSEVGGHE